MKVKRRRGGRLVQLVAAAEREAILAALEATLSWNVAGAARDLGVPLSTFKVKMRRYRIRRPY